MEFGFFEIYHSLKRNEPVVVVTVVESRGSVPRKAGSKMIVYDDGKTTGSIGGGAIEGDVIEHSKIAFDIKRGNILSYDLRENGNREDIDLICGGYMEVMLEYVNAHQENLVLYGDACRKIENEQPFLWKAVIHKTAKGIDLERCIQDIKEVSEGRYLNSSIQKSNGHMVFGESVQPAQTAFIVGAGHVSREIARLAVQIGMKTLVFDDRAAFANKSRFPEANSIHVCPDYVNIFEPFKIARNSCIIIVTRGHSYDKEVLGQALKTKAGYIGMMGSRKKRDIIYSKLIAEGCDPRGLDRVHCPIGLPIKAETPAELAVSIVAELIDHRASSTLTTHD